MTLDDSARISFLLSLTPLNTVLVLGFGGGGHIWLNSGATPGSVLKELLFLLLWGPRGAGDPLGTSCMPSKYLNPCNRFSDPIHYCLFGDSHVVLTGLRDYVQ